MPALIIEHIRFVRVQERRARVRAALRATVTRSTAAPDDPISTCSEERDIVRPRAAARVTTRGKRDRGASHSPDVTRAQGRRERGPKRHP
jgi:hypothetical protein